MEQLGYFASKPSPCLNWIFTCLLILTRYKRGKLISIFHLLVVRELIKYLFNAFYLFALWCECLSSLYSTHLILYHSNAFAFVLGVKCCAWDLFDLMNHATRSYVVTTIPRNVEQQLIWRRHHVIVGHLNGPARGLLLHSYWLIFNIQYTDDSVDIKPNIKWQELIKYPTRHRLLKRSVRLRLFDYVISIESACKCLIHQWARYQNHQWEPNRK